MTGPLGDRGLAWLRDRTEGARMRDAEALFFRGRRPLWDRLWSGLYFALDARRWDSYAEAPAHLDPYVAGLELCAEPKRALDLCTGPGHSAARLAQRFPSAQVEAIDTSRAMHRIATRSHAVPNLRFRRASVTRLPYGDGEIDLVTALNGIAEPEEVVRVTHPGSQLMMAGGFVPAQAPDSAWARRWREVGFEPVHSQPVGPGHFELWRRPS